MANNYTQTTVEPSKLVLSRPIAAVLKAHGAGLEGEKPDTALDQLVRGDRNLKDIYVFFEEGWSDYEPGYGPHDLLINDFDDEEKKEVERLLALDDIDLYREVLLVNPEVEALEIKSAYYCSKMRPGEFGGGCLTVTRTQYCYVGDNCINLVNGKIKVDAKVHTFKKTKAKKS